VANTALKFCWKTAANMPNEDFGTHLDTLAARLLDSWATPSGMAAGTFTKHTEMLSSIWKQLQANPKFEFMDASALLKFTEFSTKVRQIKDPAQRPSAETVRDADYLCQQMIQLMENVYLDLRLDADPDHADNRGWVTLFKSWAKIPVLREAWHSSRDSFGRRFQVFFDHLVEK
jgi:hypothetical protein